MLVSCVCVTFVARMAAPCHGQANVERALVGKWEGQFTAEAWDTRRGWGRTSTEDPRRLRTLVIGAIREQGGKWIAEGARYGETGKSLGKVDLRVEAAGQQVTIDFTTGAGNPVKLALVKEDELVGTITVKSGAGAALR
jgi:Ni/Co efflux regulator RcnB